MPLLLLSAKAVIGQGLTDLEIDSSGQGHIHLSWPADGLNTRLERSVDLQTFVPAPELPEILDDHFKLTVPALEKSLHFRLREAHPLMLTLNEGLTVQAAEEFVLTPAMMEVGNPQTPPEDIVYHLANDGFTVFQSGYLAFVDAPAIPISRFTQADLDAGRVLYRDGFDGIVLPEIRADVFNFHVLDSANGASGPRSFLLLRNPSGVGPDDDVMLWSVGHGDQLIDAGIGDDALVLRGSDGTDGVAVTASEDGARVVLTVNGTETVTLDGTEDLYFMMGHGHNSVTFDGDLSQTDLSPSTICYAGGIDPDVIDGPPPDTFITDLCAMMEGGSNEVRGNWRATFVSTHGGADFFNYNASDGFKHCVFPGASPVFSDDLIHQRNRIVVDQFLGSTPSLNVHLEEFDLSRNVLATLFDFVLHLDFTFIQEMFHPPNELVDGGPVIVIDRGPHSRDEISAVEAVYLVDEPAPGSSANNQLEILNHRAAFIGNRIADPVPVTAYRIPPDAAGMTPITPDPSVRNALIGEVAGHRVEVIDGADLDDILFAGDDPRLADEDIPTVPPANLGDALNGKGGNDWMVGDRFDNLFNGGLGDDRMEGRRGNDTFLWSGGQDLIDGGAGIDLVDYSTDPIDANVGISVAGAGGTYTVSYGEVDSLVDIETIRGTPLADRMTGGFLGGIGPSHFIGGGGDDVLSGGMGNDYLEGGLDDDEISGQQGEDRLEGGPGNDTLEGMSGDDRLRGDAGNDTVDGGRDQDRVFGGDGDDLGIFRVGDVGSDHDLYDGEGGNDTLRIHLREGLSAAQATDLVALQAHIAEGTGVEQSYDALQLTVAGWETLEIVDSLGDPVDPAAIPPQSPTDLALSRELVEEESSGAFVGELIVEDPNNPVGDEHTFDFSDARFEVRNKTDLHLVAGLVIDFELEPAVNLVIGATDSAGHRIEEVFTIQVVDLPDTPLPPTDIRLSNSSLQEEHPGQAVGFVEVDDDNPGETHTFMIDDARFEVVDFILELKETSAVDFETESSVPIVITVEDKDGLTSSRSFTLTVIDIDESAGTPSLPSSHLFTDGSNGFDFIAFPEGRPAVSLAPAGDLTGDGFEDLLSTSVERNSAIDFANFVFLIPGGPSPFPNPLPRSQLAARGGTIFELPLIEDEARSGAAGGIGDFNGDGMNDLAASSGFGDLYLLLGRLGGLPAYVDLTDPATFDGITAFKIEGNSSANRLGGTVASAGDIDGDGYRDLLAGFGTELGGDGGALILYGSGAVFPPVQEMDSISGLRFTIIDSGSATSIGDINADGYADCFVSGVEPAAGVILFGQAGGLPQRVDPAMDWDVLISGGANRSLPLAPGTSGPAGDVNSDGIEDFYLLTQAEGAPITINNELIVLYGAISFPGAISLGANTGGGANGVSPIPYLSGGARGFQIVPGGNFGRPSPSDSSFASGVAGGGDVNGDGNSDFILRVSNTAESETEHVVMFGSPFVGEQVVLDPTTLSATDGVAFDFPVDGSGYRLDQGLTCAMDLNGDGFDDLALANYLADIGFGNTASQADVLFGGDFGSAVTHPGSAGDDFLLGGRLTDDILMGGLGNDTLVGQGRRDTYYGGMGDDLMVIRGTSIPEYVRIDGGGGTDTVRLGDSRLTWNLGKAGNSSLNPAGNHLVKSIEVLDLGRDGGATRHSLLLGVDDLSELPGEGRSLTVIGDAFDSLTFFGKLALDGTVTRNGLVFRVFSVESLPGFELAVSEDMPVN